MRLPISLLLLGTLATSSVLAVKAKTNDKVLLSKVKTLTLRGDAQTAHRRVSAVPQLKCLTPKTCRHYEVDLMRCTNQGSDYEDENIQWSCTANLPEDFKLGSTDVICEGYDSADDPYVLKGSCGVEYRLVLTDKGEEKYGKLDPKDDTSSEGFKTFFALIFLAVVVWILYGLWTAMNTPQRAGGGNGGNGWGGGGGGNDDDYGGPPPPYSKYGSSGNRNPGEAWRPGFWTGAGVGGAAGGAAGYAAGRAAGRRQSQSPTWNTPRSSSSSSSPTSSTINHTSTGFGSTSRR